MKLAFVLLLLPACGARTALDAPMSATVHVNDDGGSAACVDEVIASDAIGSQVIAVDGDTVFWAGANGKQYRHDASGTTELCSECYALSIAVDDAFVYAAAPGGVSIVSRAGGSVAHVDAPGAFAVARRGDALLYMTQTSVVALAPAAAPTSRTTIVDGLDHAEYLAVDDTNVFVSSKSGIVRASLGATNQAPTTLATTSSVGPVAAFGGDVYYADDLASNGGSVFKVPAAGGPATALSDMTANVERVDFAVDASGVYEAIAIDPELGELDRIAPDGTVTVMVDILLDQIVSAVRTTDTAVYYTVLPQNPDGFPHPPAVPVVVKICK